MGKTTILEEVFEKYYRDKDDVSFVSVSSDGIRKRLLDEYREENPDKSIDDAFSATRTLLGNVVSNYLIDSILETKTSSGKLI